MAEKRTDVAKGAAKTEQIGSPFDVATHWIESRTDPNAAKIRRDIVITAGRNDWLKGLPYNSIEWLEMTEPHYTGRVPYHDGLHAVVVSDTEIMIVTVIKGFVTKAEFMDYHEYGRRYAR